MRTYLFSIVICCLCVYTRAQDNFGALYSNYSPTNSVHINPSSILDARTWLDIHVVGAGGYINNTMAAFENTTVPPPLEMREFTKEDLKFNEEKDHYNLYNRNFVQGLSGVWSQGDHAVGLSIGGYTYTDVRRLDDHILRFIENGVTTYTPQHLEDYPLKRFRANFLAYNEVKFTYAHTFSKGLNHMFMTGISYKKIFPIVGAAINLPYFSYNVKNDKEMFVNRIRGDAMVSSQQEFSMRGGWGVDLGFTYQHMHTGAGAYYPNSKKGGCNPLHYKYKVGISINDLGYARFNPNSITYVGYLINNFNVIDYPSLPIDSENFPETFVNNESNPDQGEVRNPHKMRLPTSIAIQFDANILPHYFYLNVSWLHGIPPREAAFGPRRAHTIAVTPRIETKWFDFALPFSLYEYRQPQLGASMRLYFLTIGTDKLLNYFITSDIYGADIYLHVKIPLFINPKCKGGTGLYTKKRAKFGRNTGCYW